VESIIVTRYIVFPRDTHARKHWLEYATGAFAVVAALAAGFAAFYTAHQVRIAEQQMGVARDTEHRQLRAYVFGNSEYPFSSPTPQLREGELLRYKWHIKNYGLTPAYRVLARAEIFFAASTPEELPELIAPDTDTFVLAPGATTYVSSPDPYRLSKRDSQDLAKGVKRVSFRGRIDYADTFGSHHFSTMCIDIEMVQEPPGSKAFVDQLMSCSGGRTQAD
jgi:hypothetical protein